jgi:hypothetical protein
MYVAVARLAAYSALPNYDADDNSDRSRKYMVVRGAPERQVLRWSVMKS